MICSLSQKLLRWWQQSSPGKCLRVIRPTGDTLAESRGQTPNTRASELSLLTSARQRWLPAERPPLEKSFMVIVISLCFLNMFFSAQQPTLVDKAENWFYVSCKSELAHSRNIHINKVARSRTHKHARIRSHTHTVICKHWKMDIISNSSRTANSFVSFLRYHHFSSSLVPSAQNDYIGKERADGTGERGSPGNKGWRRRRRRKWKQEITDQRVTQDEFLMQAFVGVFLSENALRCYIGVLRTCRTGGATQTQRIIVR